MLFAFGIFLAAVGSILFYRSIRFAEGEWTGVPADEAICSDPADGNAAQAEAELSAQEKTGCAAQMSLVLVMSGLLIILLDALAV